MDTFFTYIMMFLVLPVHMYASIMNCTPYVCCGLLWFCTAAVGHYGTLPNTKTMGNISEHAVAHSIPTSPSHGSLALCSTFSPTCQQPPHNLSSPHSELSSPVFRGSMTLDHRHKTLPAKVDGPCCTMTLFDISHPIQM